MNQPLTKRSFPSWTAPAVGMIVGALAGLRAGLGRQVPITYFIVGGMIIGALAGAFIFLLDTGPVPASPANLPPHLADRFVQRPSGVVGRFLAVAGCGLCWAPFLGLILNLAGLLVNWKAQDWAKSASWVRVTIGAGVTLVMVVLLVLEN